jgi:predicted DNA-binding transcriptional regulator YafY
MMFGDYARVIEPEDFRKKIKELAEKTTANLSEVFSAQLQKLQ